MMSNTSTVSPQDRTNIFIKSSHPVVLNQLTNEDRREELIRGAVVDLQINGISFMRKGHLQTVDFSNPNLSVEDVLHAAVAIYKTGTPFFLATIVTSTPEVLKRNAAIIVKAMQHPLGKGILGIHFEGPWFDIECKGAHQGPIIIANPPSIQLAQELYEASKGPDGKSAMAMVTMSPNYPTSAETIHKLAELGVVVSLGHFQARDLDNIDRAIDAGATGATHIGNGWSKDGDHYGARHQLIYRLLSDSRIKKMVIGDPFHCEDEFLNIMTRTLFATVSDGSPGIGAMAGTYLDIFYSMIDPKTGKPPIVAMQENGHLKTEPLTGSCHTLPQQALLIAARNFKHLNPTKVLASTMSYPAHILAPYLKRIEWKIDINHLKRCLEHNLLDWQESICEYNASECEQLVKSQHANWARQGLDLSAWE